MIQKNFVLYCATDSPLVGLALHFSFTLYTYLLLVHYVDFNRFKHLSCDSWRSCRAFQWHYGAAVLN